MPDSALPQLARWSNFYVILGSSAGALTGLQFVVLTLVAQARAARSQGAIRAFATPTIVHFVAALLISAIACVPWQTFGHLGACLAVFGAIGVVYVLAVIRHARRQTGYQPDAEDWIWYTALPLVAYIALTAAGALLPRSPTESLFALAAVAFSLVVIGIHNAWDTITYIALTHLSQSHERRE